MHSTQITNKQSKKRGAPPRIYFEASCRTRSVTKNISRVNNGRKSSLAFKCTTSFSSQPTSSDAIPSLLSLLLSWLSCTELLLKLISGECIIGDGEMDAWVSARVGQCTAIRQIYSTKASIHSLTRVTILAYTSTSHKSKPEVELRSSGIASGSAGAELSCSLLVSELAGSSFTSGSGIVGRAS